MTYVFVDFLIRDFEFLGNACISLRFTLDAFFTLVRYSLEGTVV